MTTFKPPDLQRPAPFSARVATFSPDAATVVVTGEVDLLTAGQLRAVAEDVLEVHRPARLEIDLAGVTFLDSSGINTLVALAREAGDRAATLAVVRAQAQVARVLAITGVAEFLGLS